MTYQPNVVTAITQAPSTMPRQVTVETILPDTLTITASLDYPTQTARYKIRRGQPRLCGFYLRWTNYVCALQAEPPGSLIHTFTFDPPPTDKPIWIAIAKSCHPLPKEFATPPIPLPGVTTEMPLAAAQYSFTGTLLITPGGATIITWDNTYYSYDFPAQTLPGTDLLLPSHGIYLLDIYVDWDSQPVGTVTYNTFSDSPSPNTSYQVTRPLSSNDLQDHAAIIMEADTTQPLQLEVNQQGPGTKTITTVAIAITRLRDLT